MSAEHTAEAGVDRVAELLHERIGLRAEPSLRGRLRRCIRDDAAGRFDDGETYLASLRDVDALQRLVDRVTVQETAFFRHPEQFEMLARDVLSTLAQPVTIWSAGCANGQEAYSLAMLLEELGVAGTIVATDISTAALERTQEGRYRDRELTGLSPERIARHLTRSGDGWQVTPNVRNRVRVVRHNLLDPIPGEVAAARLVFCRNVLIYFAPEHIARFLDNVAGVLPQALLFLGSAETLWPMSARFETVQVGGTFFYRSHATPPRTRVLPPVARHVVRTPDADARPAARVRASVPPHRTRSGVASRPAEPSVDDRTAAEALSRIGEQAMAAGDHEAAVVAFRKCAYLAPHDALAHLHLGLALDAFGDRYAARRAYAAARRALAEGGAHQLAVRAEGYTTDELERLLDSRLEAVAQ
jgi:chemotaxis protein methyltransferase CheR